MKNNLSTIKKMGGPFSASHFYNILDKLILFIISSMVIIFILYPIIMVIIKSIFINGNLTFDLYQSLISNNIKLFKNSIFIALLTTFFSTIFSVCMAIYTNFSTKKLKALLITVYLLTMISPPFVSSLSYIILFGRRGLVTHDIIGLTLNTYGWQGIVSMQILSFASLNTLILIGFMSSIDKNIVDASLDLGEHFSRTVIRVIIPLMKPGIFVIILLTFIRSLSDFGTPMIIGGAFNVLATEAYLNVIAYGNLEKAAAICVLIFLPSLLAFYFYHKFIGKSAKTGNSIESIGDTYGSADGILKIFRILTIIILVAIVLQYISIFISALTKYSRGSMYFTFDNFIEISKYNSSSFIRSVLYSFIAAVLGSLIGFLIGYYLQIRKFKYMKFIDFICTVPYIIPGTFFGIGYILAFNKYPIELTGTSLIVILNVLFKQLPMSTKVNNSRLSQFNPEIEFAAKDVGAKDFFVLKDILIPFSKSSFMISFINHFTATMTTVGSIIFLVYPGKKLATIEMFDAIQSGEYGAGSAIACTIIIITLTINIIFAKSLLEGKNIFSNK